MQVFLSYARPDEPFAKALTTHLQRQGLSVWTDEAILPGDNVWLRIGEALEKSKAMVVLVSPDSMRSEYVRREIEYALGDPKYEGRVFTVEVRPTRDIPWILTKFKRSKSQNAEEVSNSIAGALRENVRQRSFAR